MLNTWQLQEAKSKFSELVNVAVADGPQFVTKHGKEAVVVLSMEDYSELEPKKKQNKKHGKVKTLKDFLMDGPKVDLDITRQKDYMRDIDL